MFRTLVFYLLLVTAALAWSTIVPYSRRTLFQQAIVTTAGLIGGSGLPNIAAANAAYTREVGGEGKSAEQAAFNIQVSTSRFCTLQSNLDLTVNDTVCQAKLTNERLERSGFKLDTKEEETARLADALGSFNYDATGDGKKKSSNSGKTKSSTVTQK